MRRTGLNRFSLGLVAIWLGFASFQGNVELKAAGQQKGDAVSGSLKGAVYEMRGGFGR